MLEDGDLQRPNWRAATLADLCRDRARPGRLRAARAPTRSESARGRAAARGSPSASPSCASAPAIFRDGRDLMSASALAGLEEGSFNHACALEIARRDRAAGKETDGEASGPLRGRARERSRSSATAVASRTASTGSRASRSTAGDLERAGRLHGAAERIRKERGRRPTRPTVPSPTFRLRRSRKARALTFDEAVADGACLHRLTSPCRRPGISATGSRSSSARASFSASRPRSTPTSRSRRSRTAS